MRLMRVGDAGEERPAVVAPDGTLLDLSPVIGEIDAALLESGLEHVRTAFEGGLLEPLPPATRRIGPPITGIGKIVCVGLNYADHARESNQSVPPEPVLFLKNADVVTGPNDTVLIPRTSVRTDYEIELAVIIGRTARYLDSPAEAADAIAGYAISDDVSERDFQLNRGGQWDKGKNCETFNPLGPWLVTADEVDDPQALGMRLWVNDEIRQDSSTTEMVVGVHRLVWYISQFMVLRPGDVVNTGTPAGVALGRGDDAYLRRGDVVRLEIDHLGSQRHTIGAA